MIHIQPGQRGVNDYRQFFSNLEMSWLTFGGEYYEIYEALVKAWCIQMNLATDEENVEKYFRLNLERGIAYLCGTGLIKNLDDLVMLTFKERKN